MNKIRIEDLEVVFNIKDIKDLEIKYYVSIRDKIAMINKLVDIIMNKNENDMLEYNSVNVRILRSVAAISLYTNIELLEDDYENYDILCKNGLIYDIEEEIGIDINEFYELLDITLSDKMREDSINHILSRKADDLVLIINRTMKHVDGMLDKGDPNKIAKYMSKTLESLIDKLPDMSKLDVLKSLKGMK